MIDLTTSLGDLVTQDPRRARVLERHGLDYCCGGGQSLADAAADKGLDAASVASELEIAEPGPAPEWQSLGLGDLADHIVETHHRYLWDEMPRLGQLVEKVHSVHGGRHPELTDVRNDYYAAAQDLALHLRKEEQILFPLLHELEDPGAQQGLGVDGPIRQMMAEHDVAGALFEHMRTVTGGWTVPADGCASYRAMIEGLHAMEDDLHEHIHKENNVLFPRALGADA